MKAENFDWGWGIGDRERELVKETPGSIASMHVRQNAIIFERAVKEGYSIIPFMKAFMRSETAERFDLPLNPYRWEGADSLWDDFLEEAERGGIKLPSAEGLQLAGPELAAEMAYWAGFVYREWHFLTGARSIEMAEMLPPDHLIDQYAYGHMTSAEVWLEEEGRKLIEELKTERAAAQTEFDSDNARKK